MAQSRRASASRHSTRQHSEPPLNDSLKSIPPNNPTTPPYKRRATGNENKSKTSPAKRDSDPLAVIGTSTQAATGSGSLVAVTSWTPQMSDLGHRRMVSGTITGGPRTNIIISLPTSGIVKSPSEVKMEPRDFDDLESTSKGDLQFSLDVSDSMGTGNATSGSTESMSPSDVSETVTSSTSEMGVIDPGPSSEATDTRILDVVEDPPQIEDTTMTHPTSRGTSSPPPSRIAPLVPSTPKRQVKLATSNSSAAAWFATGPISSAKKKDPDPKDSSPPMEPSPAEQLPEIHLTPSLVEEPDITPVVFNIAETSHTVVHPVVIKEPSPPDPPENGAAMQKEMSMTDMLQIPLGPSTEMAGVSAPSSGAFRVDTSVFVQCIFRPYARRATSMVSPSSSTPTTPEKNVSSGVEKGNVKEMPVIPIDEAVNLAVLDERPVTPTDDKSEDSIILVRGENTLDETEGVKRRWFREEMRQSPERDGIWTVEEGEVGFPNLPELVEAPPMATTVSSLSTEFIMVEVPVNDQVTINDKPTPVIEPPSIENTAIEPTKVPSVSSATIDSPPEIKVPELLEVSLATPIKQKFKVIGGRVVNILDTPKQEHATPTRPEVSIPGISTIEPPSEKETVSDFPQHKMETLRQRKQARKQSINKRRQSIAKSDGWSTEAEDGPGTTESSIETTVVENPQIPGMVTDLPVAEVFVPVAEAIATPEFETPEIVIAEITTHPDILAEQPVIGESATTDEVPSVVETALLPSPNFLAVEDSQAASDAEEPGQDTITTTSSAEAITPALSVTNPEEPIIVEDHQEEEVEKPQPKIDVKQLSYQIVEGKVLRKSSASSIVPISTPGPSDPTSPLGSPARSTSSLPAIGQVYSARSSRRVCSDSLEIVKERIAAHISSDMRFGLAPPPPGQDTEKAAAVSAAAAEKFVKCGSMADVPTTASLTRMASPWPGSPYHAHERGIRSRPHNIGRDGKRTQEDAQFAYGKTHRINQPSRREESFDPYAHESPKHLKFLQGRNMPILESHDAQQLKEMFGSRPYCFCGMPCAQFSGVVPVYVCGMFQRGIVISEHTFGCSFHMHVPFWECLRDTFAWNKYDKVKTFSSEALVPHLNACPYLNFTFCVKFSQINDFNMYLPAEIRAVNFCACDLDMRLDFSQIMQQWAFSCPHYHQAGVPVKCVRRIFVHETRYRLLEESANLHGGASSLNIQTVVPADIIGDSSDEPFPTVKAAVHLPHMEHNVPELPARDEDIFTDFYRATVLNAAGSRAWLGSNPTEEDIDSWTRRRQDWDRMRLEKVEEMREQYLRLEKLLDEALCEKIRQEEHMKREDARLRLRANVVTCLACCEASAMCVFLPCFHMVMCERCGEKVKQCPSCRRQVEDRQRVYTA